VPCQGMPITRRPVGKHQEARPAGNERGQVVRYPQHRHRPARDLLAPPVDLSEPQPATEAGAEDWNDLQTGYEHEPEDDGETDRPREARPLLHEADEPHRGDAGPEHLAADGGARVDPAGAG